MRLAREMMILSNSQTIFDGIVYFLPGLWHKYVNIHVDMFCTKVLWRSNSQ